MWREISVILTYLIYLNGQRPGVEQKMKIDEWKAKHKENGEHVAH